MISDDALQQWTPTERREAQALVRAVLDRARTLGVALSDPPPAFDPMLRALYENRHSRNAFRAGLAAVLADQMSATSR